MVLELFLLKVQTFCLWRELPARLSPLGADGSGVLCSAVRLYAARVGRGDTQQVRWLLPWCGCALEKAPRGGTEGGGEHCLTQCGNQGITFDINVYRPREQEGHLTPRPRKLTVRPNDSATLRRWERSPRSRAFHRLLYSRYFRTPTGRLG
jgi:hypothetical protein